MLTTCLGLEAGQVLSAHMLRPADGLNATQVLNPIVGRGGELVAVDLVRGQVDPVQRFQCVEVAVEPEVDFVAERGDIAFKQRVLSLKVPLVHMSNGQPQHHGGHHHGNAQNPTSRSPERFRLPHPCQNDGSGQEHTHGVTSPPAYRQFEHRASRKLALPMHALYRDHSVSHAGHRAGQNQKLQNLADLAQFQHRGLVAFASDQLPANPGLQAGADHAGG